MVLLRFPAGKVPRDVATRGKGEVKVYTERNIRKSLVE